MVLKSRISKSRAKKSSPPSAQDAADWATGASARCPMPPPLNIPFAHYAMIYMDDMGEVNVAVSPSAHHGSGSLFTQDVQQRFLEIIRGENGSQQPSQATGSSSPLGKRRRPSPADELPSTPMQNRTALRIGDSDKVLAFYWDSFRRFHQHNCRTLAKEWVKFAEPKKQVRHPYRGDKKTGNPDLTKPPWWPADVQHKEPDHIRLDARITLLVHMLCNLGKWKNITTRDLKDIADSCRRRLSARHIGYLDEVMKVRMVQERFERGEVDPGTIVYVNQDLTSKPPDDDDLDEPEVKAEPEEPEELTTLPTYSNPMPTPSGSFENEFCTSFGTFDPARRLSHTASFYSPSAEFTSSPSAGGIMATPTSSVMSSPYEQAPASCDSLAQGPFFPSPDNQFHASHRHASVSVHPQPGQVDAWMPPFRHNMFSAVDYGTAQPVMSIPPASPMPDPVHAQSHGLRHMSPRTDMADPRTMNSFRTGSLGHPNMLPPDN